MSVRTALRVIGLALPLAAARADPLSFTYGASIYQDAREGALRAPEGVACAGSSVAVADTGNGRLLLFRVKDSGAIDPTAEVKLSQLPSPVRLQIDSKGNLLALDGKSHRIVRVDASGAFGGFVDLKGVAASPLVLGFKLDASDNLYALDAASGKVLVASSSGDVVRQIAAPRGSILSDLAVDGGGTVYAVDPVRGALWAASAGATEFAPLGKSLKDRMSFPGSLTAFGGRLVLVDQHGMGLVVLGADGSYLGRQLAMGRNDGFVYYPSQLCINEKGEAFLADRGNNRVQQFTTAR